MGRHFDNELRDLKFGLLAMAGQVEEMIGLTCQALLERSNAKVEEVHTLDQGVDEMEIRLDQACIDLLALRAPIATDLRIVASALKIVPELERIGDHCCNICRRARLLNAQPPILNGDLLERLGAETHGMVKRAVDAFVEGDAAAARAVIADDDRVDALYLQIFGELLRLMLADLDRRPAGETPAQAQDRLSSISSLERARVLEAARAAEARAQEIREALRRKAAQEGADKWARE